MLNVTCNKCGKPYVRAERNLHRFGITFEYGSEHDGDIWQFKLCEECICELIHQFTIPHSVIKSTELV